MEKMNISVNFSKVQDITYPLCKVKAEQGGNFPSISRVLESDKLAENILCKTLLLRITNWMFVTHLVPLQNQKCLFKMGFLLTS